jgi:hypothetical protein
MKIKERYRAEDQFSSFPHNEIAEMGDKIESILSKGKITADERIILEFLEIHLLFRINIPKGDDNPYTISLKKAIEKPVLPKEEMYILGFWARGSRKNEEEALSEIETKILYERIREKLE